MYEKKAKMAGKTIILKKKGSPTTHSTRHNTIDIAIMTNIGLLKSTKLSLFGFKLVLLELVSVGIFWS
ncbi:MAG: hypothetical protein D3913_14570 [Candidatus Electrothrix sp. LOE1_4_5]|nr:hypothetical protein [Candidatus Electrothrix gigas]